MSYTNRVILLIDMDCFYCQVEENLDPTLKGKPIAVVQYNQWRGGGIIAVNYPAKDRGVTRHMRGNEAKEKCPEIVLVKVPQVRGKADLTKYRDAGKRVADVLQTFTIHLERASVDEAYLDITEIIDRRINDYTCEVTPDNLPNTFVVESETSDFIANVTSNREYSESNFKLAMGGVIAEEIRAEVYKVTGYKCSAGIAHNKILAKLVCGLHKPDKQTILPHAAVSELYEKLPIGKIKGLGGKFGNAVAKKLAIEYVGQLEKFGQKELAKKFDEKAASWLYNIARGIDMEPVITRLISKSIGCCKRFPGRMALVTQEDVEHWLNELAAEMSKRLEKDLEENNRRAKQMVVSFAQETNGEKVSSTRTHPLNSYEQNKIFENAVKVIQKNCLEASGSYVITFLGISVSTFHDVKKVKEITSFFTDMKKSKNNGEDLKLENFRLNRDKEVNGEVNDPKPDLVYSCSTEEDADASDYVYYEQIKPESVADQTFIFNDNRESDVASNASEDSITHEFGTANLEAKGSSSFFTRYFDNNANRNFNTSKVLERGNDDLDTTEEANDGNKDAKSGDEQVKESNIVEHWRDDDIKRTKNSCPECGKVVNCLDYQSHMDYHFAINMVKQEAHLYKPEGNKRNSSTSKLPKPSKSPKRNKCDAVKSNPIAQLFKINAGEAEELNSRSCLKCNNKRIRLDDWEVHMDFHAAKKLHLEINAKEIVPAVTGENFKKLKGQRNIRGFLKRS